MIHSIYVSDSNWEILKSRLISEHGRKILMLREKCRAKLGFTVRYHSAWVCNDSRWQKKDSIYLDFYDPSYQLIFFMKYSDIIDLSVKT